jgi:hypothetical protein
MRCGSAALSRSGAHGRRAQHRARAGCCQRLGARADAARLPPPVPAPPAPACASSRSTSSGAAGWPPRRRSCASSWPALPRCSWSASSPRCGGGPARAGAAPALPARASRPQLPRSGGSRRRGSGHTSGSSSGSADAPPGRPHSCSSSSAAACAPTSWTAASPSCPSPTWVQRGGLERGRPLHSRTAPQASPSAAASRRPRRALPLPPPPPPPPPPPRAPQALKAMNQNDEWGGSIDPICSNKDERALRDGRVSFPSGGSPALRRPSRRPGRAACRARARPLLQRPRQLTGGRRRRPLPRRRPLVDGLRGGLVWLLLPAVGRQRARRHADAQEVSRPRGRGARACARRCSRRAAPRDLLLWSGDRSCVATGRPSVHAADSPAPLAARAAGCTSPGMASGSA